MHLEATLSPSCSRVIPQCSIYLIVPSSSNRCDLLHLPPYPGSRVLISLPHPVRLNFPAGMGDRRFTAECLHDRSAGDVLPDLGRTGKGNGGCVQGPSFALIGSARSGHVPGRPSLLGYHDQTTVVSVLGT